jgi:hypothetical protein
LARKYRSTAEGFSDTESLTLQALEEKRDISKDEFSQTVVALSHNGFDSDAFKKESDRRSY